MRWVTCANEECGKKKMVAAVETPGEQHFCGLKCQKAWKKANAGVGPLAGVGSRSTTARSKQQVRSLTQQIGGTPVRGSGAIRGLDGDRKAGECLLEEKATDGDSFRLTTAIWGKCLGEAGRNGRKAALVLDMGGHRILMMPMHEALEIEGVRERLGVEE